VRLTVEMAPVHGFVTSVASRTLHASADMLAKLQITRPQTKLKLSRRLLSEKFRSRSSIPPILQKVSAEMIEISNVSKRYGKFQVLTDCSTRVAKGEVVVVCGPSGSGKSTLIKTINGLEPIQEGNILVNGISVCSPKTNLSKLRSRVGMVFQHFELFPHLSIIENLTIAQVKVLRRPTEEATERGLKYLARVGLKDHAFKHPAQLSGGQQQRAACTFNGSHLHAVRRTDVGSRPRDGQRSA
jgi:ABC-type bacteriocin/lantibiotic exporter with double-glycine peptidase domain